MLTSPTAARRCSLASNPQFDLTKRGHILAMASGVVFMVRGG